MKIDKLHWGAIISLITGLAVIGMLVSGIAHGAPTSRVNGVKLAANEIRGYSVLLNGVPIGFTAATIFEFTTPATAGQVTLVAVDIHGLESIQSAPFKVGGA